MAHPHRRRLRAAERGARGKIDLGRIERQWPDILRVVASINTGAVPAYDILRVLAPGGTPTQLGDALAHYGAMPQDIEDASAEITRLLKLTNTSSADRTREKRAVQHDLQTRPNDATAIREGDVVGYGSSARWAHRPDTGPRS